MFCMPICTLIIIKNNNMSADDSFSSDSDNFLPEPINEIESGEENSHGDHMGVRPYRFETFGAGYNNLLLPMAWQHLLMTVQ